MVLEATEQAGAEDDSFSGQSKALHLEAKLRRRWSFSALYSVVHSDPTSKDFEPPQFLGGSVEDRLTLAASVGMVRRKAEWLDGEIEYMADSHRHQVSQRPSQGMGGIHAPDKSSSSGVAPLLRQKSFSQRAKELQRQNTQTSLSGMLSTRSRQKSGDFRSKHRGSVEALAFDNDTLTFWRNVAQRASAERKSDHESWTKRFRHSRQSAVARKSVLDRKTSVIAATRVFRPLRKKSFWLGRNVNTESPPLGEKSMAEPSSLRSELSELSKSHANLGARLSSVYRKRTIRFADSIRESLKDRNSSRKSIAPNSGTGTARSKAMGCGPASIADQPSAPPGRAGRCSVARDDLTEPSIKRVGFAASPIITEGRGKAGNLVV